MLPLAGMLVVSVEQAVSAPFATRQLADLGARVIKVERPDGGDFARGYDHSVRGLATHFVWLNRSKESLAVDLKTKRGKEIIDRLLASADVFTQNLAPGAAARYGLGAEELTAAHPRLVAVDLSGYGAHGPFRDKRAYDLLVQAETGLVSVTGTPADPVKAGIPVADIAAGMYVFSGVLAALLRRERTGRGAALEITMFDTMIEWLGHQIQHARHTGEQPPRMGLSHPAIAPYNRRPELGTDPKYATNVARTANRDAVDRLVTEATTRLTAAELIARLDTAGIASARLNEVPDVLDHPQLTTRDRWRDIDSPVGPLPVPLPPITFPGDPPRLEAVPALGQHTDAILAELGYGKTEIADLHATATVGP
jgi:itaconate CoA-transferase